MVPSLLLRQHVTVSGGAVTPPHYSSVVGSWLERSCVLPHHPLLLSNNYTSRLPRSSSRSLSVMCCVIIPIKSLLVSLATLFRYIHTNKCRCVLIGWKLQHLIVRWTICWYIQFIL